MRAALLLLLAAALVACGETTRESACSLFDNGDGTRTLRCGEDTLILPGTGDGTTCVKSPAADGGAVIACTDGTTIVLDADGNVIHRGAGAVIGRVTLFGEKDHTGTTVRAVGTERSAITDEKGDFYLAGLDAGVYDLLFERPGWEPVRHRNTIAVGGILYLEPVLLRRGRYLVPTTGTLEVSPTEDTLLVQDGRGLWLHPVDRLDPVELSPHAPLGADGLGAAAKYHPEGTAVVFLENFDPVARWARLRRHDIAARESVTLAERALRAVPLAGGRTLIWLAPADATTGPVATAEVLVRYPDGAELVLGTSETPGAIDSAAPGATAIAVGTEAGLILVDLDARQQFPVAPGATNNVAAWSADGRQAVVASTAPGATGWHLFHVDLRTGTTVALADGALFRLGATIPTVQFSPDGTRVLYLGDLDLGGSSPDSAGAWNWKGQLRVVDTRTFEETPAADPSTTFLDWQFMPDGAAVLYRRGAETLVHWDRADDRLTPLGAAPLTTLQWAPRGDRFAFVDAGTCRLIRPEGGASPAIFLIPKCESIRFLPDGDRTVVVLWNQAAKRDLTTWTGTALGPVLAELPGDSSDPAIRFAEDGTAVLWQEGRSGEREVRFLGILDGVAGGLPPSQSYWATFSPDGTFVVVRGGSTGQELIFHELATGITTTVDPAVRYLSPSFRDFVLFSVDPELERERAGWWLAPYPRTADAP